MIERYIQTFTVPSGSPGARTERNESFPHGSLGKGISADGRTTKSCIDSGSALETLKLSNYERMGAVPTGSQASMPAPFVHSASFSDTLLPVHSSYKWRESTRKADDCPRPGKGRINEDGRRFGGRQRMIRKLKVLTDSGSSFPFPLYRVCPSSMSSFQGTSIQQSA